MDLIQLKSLKKIYRRKQVYTNALGGIDLTVGKGEFVAIMGPSGSGKSTLLHILGLMDSPTEGEYVLNGQSHHHLRSRSIHRVRNSMIGFVFQYFALLKDYTALENVALPLTYRKSSSKERKEKAKAVLVKVGLAEHLDKKPNELSGGQQQRVAIARALVGEPELILADEPTGNLDRKTGEEIVGMLRQLNQEGKTIVIVTHDPEVAKQCGRIIEIRDGMIHSDQRAQIL
ncbi:ABC transporter ATP-binding protein [Paenibacillus sp. strain BS8-2]